MNGCARFKRLDARFEPVMQFILVDPERRRFSALRMSYRGFTNHWIKIGRNGTIQELASMFIPALGKDKYFELW